MLRQTFKLDDELEIWIALHINERPLAAFAVSENIQRRMAPVAFQAIAISIVVVQSQGHFFASVHVEKLQEATSSVYDYGPGHQGQFFDYADFRPSGAQ